MADMVKMQHKDGTYSEVSLSTWESPVVREVMRLRYVEGLTGVDLAEAFQASELFTNESLARVLEDCATKNLNYKRSGVGAKVKAETAKAKTSAFDDLIAKLKVRAAGGMVKDPTIDGMTPSNAAELVAKYTA